MFYFFLEKFRKMSADQGNAPAAAPVNPEMEPGNPEMAGLDEINNLKYVFFNF